MGILGSILTTIATFINKMSALIPGFNSDTGKLSSSIAFMNTLLSKVDVIFPVSEVGKVLSLVISIYLALSAFYFITRAINLLRGSG